MCELSIIIPTYNNENTLPKCLNSIIVQNNDAIEILIINDGSTDDTKSICISYTDKYKNIRVFEKSNGGVSSARNVGIDNARGKWLLFVDSDDSLPECAIESLINDQYNTDLIIGGYKDQYDNLFNINYNKSLISQNEFNEFLSENIDATLLRTPWAKLFKNEIIQKKRLRFDENLIFGEDHVFNVSYLMHCKSISVIKETCYIYYNIGDEYINKYQKYNEKILEYFDKITLKYKNLNDIYHLRGTRIVYGFIFDILKKNFDEGACSIESFRKFLLNNEVRKTLQERQSIYINSILFFAYFPSCILNFFFSIITKTKKCLKSL